MQNALKNAKCAKKFHHDPTSIQTHHHQAIRNSPREEKSIQVLVADGHPSSFLEEVTKTRNPASKREKAEFNSTAVLPYMKGVSATTRNTYRLQVRHHTKISAGQTKRSRRPTQARWRSLQDTTRMRQVYIGETGRPMEERGMYDSLALRIPRFKNMLTELDTSRCGTKIKFIERDNH